MNANAPSATVADAPDGDPRHALGRLGEKLAAGYLRKQGYEVLDTNFRSRYGELDIVALKGETVAFVEVKARHNRRFGEPFESVTAHKQGKIRRMAEAWLARPANACYGEFYLRFDVISMILDGRGRISALEHFQDAFR